MGSSPHLWFCESETATLGPDLQVCMGPRPHLWICAHITACLAQRLYQLQPQPVALCMQNGGFKTKTTSLCGSQTSPVDLYTQKSMLITRINSLYVS